MAAKDITDLWWGLYQEHTAQGRHHETLRSSTAALVLTLAGANVTFVGFDKSLSRSDLPWGIFLCVLGIFGGIFSFKQYERFKYHTAIAHAYRDQLDDKLGHSNLSRVLKNGRDLHFRSKIYKLVGPFRMYILWAIFYAIITTLGVVIALISLVE